MTLTPWHGVLVATALPWNEDDTPNLGAYAKHVAWLTSQGCHGVTPNGSLGEYQVLTDEQRAEVMRTALEAAPADCSVIPGVGAYSSVQARRHAETAAAAGCPAVMLLPPNGYRASRKDVVDHYRAVAAVGLPVVAYNNPSDTKVDLTPALLAELFGEGLIVAVKEFSCDVRRYYQIAELAPGLDVLAGTDDLAFEFALAGSPGWVSGYPNAFPRACVDMFTAAQGGDLTVAKSLYQTLHPLLRWDSDPLFVQAIKLSMDLAPEAVNGGRCQPPRGPLSDDDAAAVRAATARAFAAGLA